MRKIRVQMPQGTGSVSVAGHEYTANRDGVVTVDHAEHVGPLVGLGGVELGDDGEPGGQTSGLMGSDRFPATIELPGEGREPVTLGDVVRETHARTTISVDEWNNLPAAIRDVLIGFRIAEMRGELGNTAEVSGELADARAKIDEHERTIDDLQSRIQELQAGAPPAGDAGTGAGETSSSDDSTGGQQDEAPQRPAFADMTKAKINEWLSANGGEPIASGDHKSHVDAADARWAQLYPAA